MFDERNRVFWDQVRRLLIWLLKQLDQWYGWKTFEKDIKQRELVES